MDKAFGGCFLEKGCALVLREDNFREEISSSQNLGGEGYFI
jgi:hypothetical protein